MPFLLQHRYTCCQFGRKGFLVVGSTVQKRRNAVPITRTAPKLAAPTYVVTGDDQPDRRERSSLALRHRRREDHQPKHMPTPLIIPAPVLAIHDDSSPSSCTATFEQPGAEDFPAERSKPVCSNYLATDLRSSI